MKKEEIIERIKDYGNLDFVVMFRGWCNQCQRIWTLNFCHKPECPICEQKLEGMVRQNDLPD